MAKETNRGFSLALFFSHPPLIDKVFTVFSLPVVVGNFFTIPYVVMDIILGIKTVNERLGGNDFDIVIPSLSGTPRGHNESMSFHLSHERQNGNFIS
jgi:hypothetical protein